MKLLPRLLPIFVVLLAACAAPTDDGDEDAEALEEGEALSGSPNELIVGFNGGPDQFDYWPDFFGEQTVKTPRLCHTYLAWNIAGEPAAPADAKADPGTRPWFQAWIERAKGTCDEALVSFKAHANGKPPSEHAYRDAVKKFLETNWGSVKLAILPWNEPNNPAPDGNGLGVKIEPELAAKYFLQTARLCKTHGCKAIAGDFASNGNFWNDYEWNCASADVDAKDPTVCHEPTDKATGAPSYMDRYKAIIQRHAKDYDLAENFRPTAFAYHGWHDVNSYFDPKAPDPHCSSYATCATRRVIRNLSGSWAHVDIWDTEVGVGQFADRAPDPTTQACTAAFMIRLHTKPTDRIKRIYITRLRGGPGTLVLADHTKRDALEVIAKRETTYAKAKCR